MISHEITTSKGEFLVVELLESPPTIYHTLYGAKLGLICKLSESTEEDAIKVVCEHKVSITIYYHNYGKYNALDFRDIIDNSFDTAIESLHSLLTSKGIDINNGNLYLFKKI